MKNVCVSGSQRLLIKHRFSNSTSLDSENQINSSRDTVLHHIMEPAMPMSRGDCSINLSAVWSVGAMTLKWSHVVLSPAPLTASRVNSTAVGIAVGFGILAVLFTIGLVQFFCKYKCKDLKKCCKKKKKSELSSRGLCLSLLFSIQYGSVLFSIQYGSVLFRIQYGSVFFTCLLSIVCLLSVLLFIVKCAVVIVDWSHWITWISPRG